jgi:hypothetical protein
VTAKPEDECGGGELGPSEDVEEAEAAEREDVLDVILVSAAHTLNVLVCPGLSEGTGEAFLLRDPRSPGTL